MSGRRDFRRRAIGALMFGLIGLFSLIERSRLQALRGADLIALIGCGMCFGVALTLFIFAFKSREA